jgi:hypothetical protein
MELEELKSIWPALQHKLQQANAINMEIWRHHKIDSARKSLRPMTLGQALQIFWGVGFILLAASLWSTRPDQASVIIAGVVVQAYGIGCVVAAGLALGAIHSIDYAGTVVEVQGKLAHVRRAYIVSSVVGGLTWWFFWLPLLMVLFGLIHVDLYANAPSVIWTGVAVGVVGELATVGLYAYSRRPSNPRLRQMVDNAFLGRSLKHAQEQVEQIHRFEQEAA